MIKWSCDFLAENRNTVKFGYNKYLVTIGNVIDEV